MKRAFLAGIFLIASSLSGNADPAPVDVVVLALQSQSNPSIGRNATELMVKTLSETPGIRVRPFKVIPESFGLAKEGILEFGKKAGAFAVVQGHFIFEGERRARWGQFESAEPPPDNTLIAEIVFPGSDQIFGEKVGGDASATLDSLVSSLAKKVAALVLDQRRFKDLPPASIQGQRIQGESKPSLSLAYVFAIDGNRVPGGMGKYDVMLPLSAGPHQIIAEYVGGSVPIYAVFAFEAKPRACYQIRLEIKDHFFSEPEVLLWIADNLNGQKVTDVVKTRLVSPARNDIDQSFGSPFGNGWNPNPPDPPYMQVNHDFTK